MDKGEAIFSSMEHSEWSGGGDEIEREEKGMVNYEGENFLVFEYNSTKADPRATPVKSDGWANNNNVGPSTICLLCLHLVRSACPSSKIRADPERGNFDVW